MIDPVIQDLNRQINSEAIYNRAVESMERVIIRDVTVFEGFLMDNREDLYNRLSQSEINALHKELQGKTKQIQLQADYYEYVHRLAVDDVQKYGEIK